MKKILSVVALLAFSLVAFGCGGGEKKETAKSSFDSSKKINVISREDGSGTRGAFIELFGVEAKDTSGKKKDMTTKEAVIVNKTDVMLTSVSNDPYAIGYISLGSLNKTVKALAIDGVEATTDNVKNKSYKISRPFNIATKGEPTGLTKDFIDFILSKQGQEVISKNYIPVNSNAGDYKATNLAGKIVVAGSSSVAPVMEKLIEAYKKLNKDANIELQLSDSTAGMTGAISGTCQIGMSSRDLKDNEKAALKPVVIALDGLAVIVNTNNPVKSLTKNQVKDVYTSKTTTWNGIK